MCHGAADRFTFTCSPLLCHYSIIDNPQYSLRSYLHVHSQMYALCQDSLMVLNSPYLPIGQCFAIRAKLFPSGLFGCHRRMVSDFPLTQIQFPVISGFLYKPICHSFDVPLDLLCVAFLINSHSSTVSMETRSRPGVLRHMCLFTFHVMPVVVYR